MTTRDSLSWTLLLAVLAGCAGSDPEPRARLARVDLPAAPHDAPEVKIPLEDGAVGKLGYAECEANGTADTLVWADVEVDIEGFIRFANPPQTGLESLVCVELIGYANELGRPIDTHTYVFRVAPKPGHEPDKVIAALQAKVDHVHTQLAAMQASIGDTKLPSTCPTSVTGRIPITHLQEENPAGVLPDALSWTQVPMTLKDEHAVAGLERSTHAALVVPGKVDPPRLVGGSKFVPGAGAATIYVGDVATGKLSCKADVRFASSDNVYVEIPDDKGQGGASPFDEIERDLAAQSERALSAALTAMAPNAEAWVR